MKKTLKQLNVNPQVVKRVVVALYEAEVNAIAHAYGGKVLVDIEPEKIHSSIGASCPSCGAMLMAPVGMSAICPYCGRKVKADESGSVR